MDEGVIPPFASSELFLGLFTLGNVNTRSDISFKAPLWGIKWRARIEYPPVFTIGLTSTELRSEFDSGIKRLH